MYRARLRGFAQFACTGAPTIWFETPIVWGFGGIGMGIIRARRIR